MNRRVITNAAAAILSLTAGVLTLTHGGSPLFACTCGALALFAASQAVLSFTRGDR